MNNFTSDIPFLSPAFASFSIATHDHHLAWVSPETTSARRKVLNATGFDKELVCDVLDYFNARNNEAFLRRAFDVICNGHQDPILGFDLGIESYALMDKDGAVYATLLCNNNHIVRVGVNPNAPMAAEDIRTKVAQFIDEEGLSVAPTMLDAAFAQPITVLEEVTQSDPLDQAQQAIDKALHEAHEAIKHAHEYGSFSQIQTCRAALKQAENARMAFVEKKEGKKKAWLRHLDFYSKYGTISAATNNKWSDPTRNGKQWVVATSFEAADTFLKDSLLDSFVRHKFSVLPDGRVQVSFDEMTKMYGGIHSGYAQPLHVLALKNESFDTQAILLIGSDGTVMKSLGAQNKPRYYCSRMPAYSGLRYDTIHEYPASDLLRDVAAFITTNKLSLALHTTALWEKHLPHAVGMIEGQSIFDLPKGTHLTEKVCLERFPKDIAFPDDLVFENGVDFSRTECHIILGNRTVVQGNMVGEYCDNLVLGCGTHITHDARLPNAAPIDDPQLKVGGDLYISLSSYIDQQNGGYFVANAIDRACFLPETIEVGGLIFVDTRKKGQGNAAPTTLVVRSAKEVNAIIRAAAEASTSEEAKRSTYILLSSNRGLTQPRLH